MARNIQPVKTLTPREKQIVELVPEMGNQELARKLHVSERTLKNHFTMIYNKTGASNRCELCRWVRSGRFKQNDNLGGNDASNSGSSD
jgi:DNA-binding NarL/FixJ family response regulator